MIYDLRFTIAAGTVRLLALAVAQASCLCVEILGKIILLCRKLLINTRLQPGAGKVREAKNRLNGFSFCPCVFTALKRGVNEMFSSRQNYFRNSQAGRLCHYCP
jgi:uncharacterized membrane protein YecN with MAPEG domain